MSLMRLAAESRHYWNNCKKSSEELQAESLRLFRRTVKRAWRTSSFYRAWYRSCGLAYADLDAIPPEHLPVLTKQMVRDHFDDIASVPLRTAADGARVPVKGTALLAHTSGSTGKPCAFLYSPGMMTRMEANFVRLSNYGGEQFVGFGDLPIRSLHVASVGRGYASSLLLTSGLAKYHARSVVLDVSQPLQSWRAALGDFQPNFISGYPSCIALVAQLQRQGEIELHPKKIISGGEPLSDAQMQELHSLFGADVINYYGCTEALLVGAGASWYDGMYLFDDLNYTELDDRSRLILTPLYNPAFPLIRYQMNDILEGFRRGDSRAALPFTHIDRVVGRAEDVLWFVREDGTQDFLHPLLLDDLDVPRLVQYQFVQRSDTDFLLRCVADTAHRQAVEEAARRQIGTMLRRKRLENITWQLVFTDHLELDAATGKVPLIVRAGRSGTPPAAADVRK